MKLDSKDEMILAMLREDARRPNVELAKALSMSEGAIRHRISNLVREGAIRRFTIETGPGAYSAIVMVKSAGGTKDMMRAISSLGAHILAYEISGDFDGCVILEGPSLEDIDGRIDSIRALVEVSDTKTYLCLKRW